MSARRGINLVASALLAGVSLFTTSCAVPTSATRDTANVMQVSVPQQKMALFREGKRFKTYPISTSKYGLGDEPGSYRTPPGRMQVAQKIGGDMPAGAVFKSRKWTGEIVKPNSPGRDPIVSRIFWLSGLESKNENAYSRCIYIHGTAAERDLGRPASYGCIRMKSKDVIDLYDNAGEGSRVYVVQKRLPAKDDILSDAEMIRAIPLTEPSIPLALNGVAPPAAKPVWNQVASFRSGYDALHEEGFDKAYLTLPDSSELGLDVAN
ncbi:MAG: L,D-transpeptidase [Verrucomicrobiales bacterium]